MSASANAGTIYPFQQRGKTLKKETGRRVAKFGPITAWSIDFGKTVDPQVAPRLWVSRAFLLDHGCNCALGCSCF